MQYKIKVGSMAQVGHGTAEMTQGGLKKSDIFFDLSDRRWKSRAQSKAGDKNPALKMWRDSVEEAGGLKEGKKFKPIKKGTTLYKKAKKIFDAKKGA
jgi:hypothetical protein